MGFNFFYSAGKQGDNRTWMIRKLSAELQVEILKNKPFSSALSILIMKNSSHLFLISILVLAGLLLVIPISAETTATADVSKPSITASVSPSSPKVGDTVTISGTARGGNLTPGVTMWIFAGNYVNVTNVQVNSSGFYSKSVNTAELPPAYYYVFLQHPGSDNRFNVNVKGYSGEVVNTNTGAVIFNFTGTGSVDDNAAAIALSNAFNSIGVDDVFSKTGVQLLPAVTGNNVTTPAKTGIQTTTASATSSTGTPLIPATTKAPLSILSCVLGIGLVAVGISLKRRN